MVSATLGIDQIGARFDWYACTVNSSVDRLLHILRDELGGEWKQKPGKHGYRHGEVLVLDGLTVASMWHGGNGDLPHAWASSEHTEAFVDVIRRYFPDRHKVTRMDTALDFDDGPGTWETLLDLVKGVADGVRVEGDVRKRARKLTTSTQGDWHRGLAGRTFYVGAFKSAVIVRYYEKGIKIRQDAERQGKPRHDVSENYVRLEVEVHPDGAAKLAAARATPLEAFGYAEWTKELLRRVDGSDVQRVNIRERRQTDHERALNNMVKQYERHILEEVAEFGGWANLGEALRRRMEMGESSAQPEAVPF